MKRLLAFFGVFLVGLIVGVVAGARVGVWEFALADAQYKASILATQIKWLRAGKTEPVLTGMEISLNDQLAKHGRHMESHLSWLWPDLKPDDDHAIRNAVAYRLANPYKEADFTKPENWKPGMDMQNEFVQQVIEGQHIEEHYLRKVLDYYGK